MHFRNKYVKVLNPMKDLYTIANFTEIQACVDSGCVCNCDKNIVKRDITGTEAVLKLNCASKCPLSKNPIFTKKGLDYELTINPKWRNKNIL